MPPGCRLSCHGLDDGRGRPERRGGRHVGRPARPGRRPQRQQGQPDPRERQERQGEEEAGEAGAEAEEAAEAGRAAPPAGHDVRALRGPARPAAQPRPAAPRLHDPAHQGLHDAPSPGRAEGVEGLAASSFKKVRQLVAA